MFITFDIILTQQNMLRILIIVVIGTLLIPGCKPREKVDEDALAKKEYVAERNPVEVMVLQRTTFKKERVSNCKLKAMQKSVLKFRTGSHTSWWKGLPENLE